MIRKCLSKSAILAIAALTLTSTTPPLHAWQDPATVVTQVEALAAAGEYLQAVELLRPAVEAAPDDYVLLCHLADNITEWARTDSENATKDESEARYEEAVGFARRAIEVDRADSEGWYQLGKGLGRLALFRGGKEKVNMSKEIKETFEHAIQLDGEHDQALHGLARWHREVANLGFVLKAAAKIVFGGLPPASNEQSVELFKRAIAIAPENCVHHLELGKTYLEMREKELAAAEFEAVLRLPVSDPDDPEWKAEAEQLLDRIRR